MNLIASSSRNGDKYNRKKMDILATAIKVFNENGLADTTVSRLSAAANLTKTGISYYFKRKEDLIAAGYRQSFKQWERVVTRAESASTPATRLRLFIDEYFSLRYKISCGKTAPLLDMGFLRALNEPSRSEFIERYIELFRSIRSLIQPNEFKSIDRKKLNCRTRFLQEQIQWSGYWIGRYPLNEDGYKRAAARFADIMIHGVNPDSVEWSEPGKVSYATPSKPKEIFLQKATELINGFGYRGASVEKIATRLERTKGSFYHHYTNKSELVTACFERTFSIINLLLRQNREEGTRCERLNHLISNLIWFQVDPAGPSLGNHALVALNMEKKTPVIFALTTLANELLDLISDGIIDRSLRPVDPYIASQILIDTIFSSPEFVAWFPDITIDNAAAHYASFFFKGVLR